MLFLILQKAQKESDFYHQYCWPRYRVFLLKFDQLWVTKSILLCSCSKALSNLFKKWLKKKTNLSKHNNIEQNNKKGLIWQPGWDLGVLKSSFLLPRKSRAGWGKAFTQPCISLDSVLVFSHYITKYSRVLNNRCLFSLRIQNTDSYYQESKVQ